MKNKEIEELLNKFKNADSQQFNELVEDFDNVYKLLSYIEQLENNRDKAIKFGNGLLLGEATFEERYIANRFLNILKGVSDE